MLLALDTSATTTVALLAADGAAVGEWRNDDPRGHAEQVGPLLRAALHEAGDETIDAVAYGVGPGPYTGLRVGIAAARAVAFALGAIELPVLSHDAIALAAVDDGATVPLLVTTDAKRRERFFSVYRQIDAAGIPVAEHTGVGAEPPDLPDATAALTAVSLARVALRRRAAGLPPEPAEARYLRSPDVTLAPRRTVGA